MYQHLPGRILFALFTALAPLTALPALASQDHVSIDLTGAAAGSPGPLVWASQVQAAGQTIAVAIADDGDVSPINPPPVSEPNGILGTPPIRCFATPNDGTTVYSSTFAEAVREALAAANPGATVKVAGYCAGVANQGGGTQVARITQTLTLAGGFTLTNWTTAYPITQPAKLDAESSGRGIYVDAPATLLGLVVANGSIGAGSGGGIYATQAVTLSGMSVVSSSAAGGYPNGRGGGAFFESIASVSGSTFTGNSANIDGGGATFAATSSVTGSTFSGNSAFGYGGGANFGATASVTNSQFTGNAAVSSLTNFNGPASASGDPASGGGALFGGPASVSGSSFARNSAAAIGGGAIFNSQTSVSGSSFTNNTAGTRGGGAWFDVVSTASITGSTFARNTAGFEGGGAGFGATAYVTSSTFTSNTAGSDGGGAQFTAATSVTGSTFVSNTASSGGGASFRGGAGFVVNTLFARNAATNGAGVFADATASLSLIHTTFAHSGTNSNAAIYLNSNGTVRLTNTLVSNHQVGIGRFNGSVYEDYSVFSGVTTPYIGGVASGGHSITGTAGFVNPAADNYRLGPGSSAIDAGVNAGIAVDFEGTPRPTGGGFDIGYDEAFSPLRAWLPVLSR